MVLKYRGFEYFAPKQALSCCVLFPPCLFSNIATNFLWQLVPWSNLVNCTVYSPWRHGTFSCIKHTSLVHQRSNAFIITSSVYFISLDMKLDLIFEKNSVLLSRKHDRPAYHQFSPVHHSLMDSQVLRWKCSVLLWQCKRVTKIHWCNRQD